MYIYLCKFLYVSDTSEYSANIPDEKGYTCIIKSDCDLMEFELYKIKEYYEISELLEEHDCETISLTKIDEDEYNEEYSDEQVLYINKTDIQDDTLKTFCVTRVVKGRFHTEIKASSIEDAIKKSESEYATADFGELEYVDSYANIVKDKSGNILWDRA